MAHGGGSLPRDGSPNLPINVKQEICEEYLRRRNPNDKTRAVMEGIAEEYGIHYATVVKITRHLRVQQPQQQANAASTP